MQSSPTDVSSHLNRGKHNFLLLVVSVLAFSLLIVSAMLWQEWSRRFPKMPKGAYVGYVTGVESTKKESAKKQGNGTWIYVEKLQDKLVVAVLAPGWAPQEIQELPAPVGDALLPITVSGPREKLTLIGAARNDATFSGSAQIGGNTGRWELRPVSFVEQDRNQKDLKLTLLLQAELQDIDLKIREAELRVPEQRAEIDKLTVFITEGERLKARANERFAIAKYELEKAQKELTAKQSEAKKLQEALDITQKLSGMGKLVALSRESLEREGRWVESMARSTGGAVPGDLDAAVERGEKIISLKKEIAEEQNKIGKLVNTSAASDDPFLNEGGEIRE